MATEKIKSLEIQQDRDFTITIKNQEGTSNIAEALHIKGSYLASIENLGTIRVGDKFSIRIDKNGDAIMNKYRNISGQKTINEDYIIPKEQIIQPKEVVIKNKVSVVRDILTPEQKINVGNIYAQVNVSSGSIEYNGNSITLNIVEGMEGEVKLLISQMIIRGKYYHDKANIVIRTKNQLQNNSYYESDNGNIDANDGLLLDTTIASEGLLLRLFKLKSGQTPDQIKQEQVVVAKILVNFVNGILKNELK